MENHITVRGKVRIHVAMQNHVGGFSENLYDIFYTLFTRESYLCSQHVFYSCKLTNTLYKIWWNRRLSLVHISTGIPMVSNINPCNILDPLIKFHQDSHSLYLYFMKVIFFSILLIYLHCHNFNLINEKLWIFMLVQRKQVIFFKFTRQCVSAIINWFISMKKNVCSMFGIIKGG